jgi:hypothetical protein
VECPQTTLVWRSSKSKEAKNEITLAESSTTSKNVQLQ